MGHENMYGIRRPFSFNSLKRLEKERITRCTGKAAVIRYSREATSQMDMFLSVHLATAARGAKRRRHWSGNHRNGVRTKAPAACRAGNLMPVSLLPGLGYDSRLFKAGCFEVVPYRS